MKDAIVAPRLAVIGCGAIAESFHLPALVKLPGIRERLVLVDPNQEQVRKLTERFGLIHSCSRYQELPDDVTGAVVATPPLLHFEMAKHCLRRGVHVLCEKPLTESLTDAEELVHQAQLHNAVLAVNQTRRLFPAYARIRQLIHHQELGELQSISFHDGCEFDWPAASRFHFDLASKGVLSDTGIHLLDTLGWWLDGTPELISSHNDSAGGPEAMATVRMRFGNCDIELKVSRLGRLTNCIRIRGSHGSLSAGIDPASDLNIHHGRGRSVRERFSRVDMSQLADALHRNFVHVVQDGAEPLIHGASTLPAIELLECAYRDANQYPQAWDDYWKTCHV